MKHVHAILKSTKQEDALKGLVKQTPPPTSLLLHGYQKVLRAC